MWTPPSAATTGSERPRSPWQRKPLAEQHWIVGHALRAEHHAHIFKVTAHHGVAAVDSATTAFTVGMASFIWGRPPAMHRLQRQREVLWVLPQPLQHLYWHLHTQRVFLRRTGAIHHKRGGLRQSKASRERKRPEQHSQSPTATPVAYAPGSPQTQPRHVIIRPSPTPQSDWFDTRAGPPPYPPHPGEGTDGAQVARPPWRSLAARPNSTSVTARARSPTTPAGATNSG